MAIEITNLGASTDTTAANPDIRSESLSTTYSNSAWTPPSGLILCYVWNSAVVTVQEPTLSGNGLTWELLISAQYVGTTRMVSVHAANGAGATNGATTFTFGGLQTACYGLFLRATGVDLLGGVPAAVVNADGTGTGTSGLINLGPIKPDDRIVSFFAHEANEGLTERLSWTRLDDLTGTSPANGILTQFRPDGPENVASASWTSNVAWGGFGSILKGIPEVSVPISRVVGLGARW